jgi:hypothetical protein
MRSDSLTSSSDIERQTPILNGIRNAQQELASVVAAAAQPPGSSPGPVKSSIAVFTPTARPPSSMTAALPIVEMTAPNN